MTAALVKPEVPFTRERFYMDHVMEHGLGTLKRHLNRYKWALRKLKETDVVLDAGCGSGYGDFILLSGCKTVTGWDVSGEAIVYAQWKAWKQQAQDRLRYAMVDLGAIVPSPAALRFDAVVSIEVIEHLTVEKQEAFLAALPTILKPDGRLIITTPRAQPEGKMTEFHEHEFTEEEFRGLLESGFSTVEFEPDPLQFGIPPKFLLAVCSGVRS